MKQIYAKTKTVTLMLTLLMVALFGVNEKAWGKDYNHTVKVGVGVGKGKVKAELWQSPLWGDSKVTATSEIDQDATEPASATSGIFSLTNAYGKFFATAATGYTFTSWHSVATCDNSATSTSTNFTTGKHRGSTYTFEYYAKFTPSEYTINFFSEVGSTTKIGSATVTYDAKYNKGTGWLESTTKSGYTFDGWYKNDGTTLIKGTDVVYITSNTALYAHWKANSYVVTLESNVATNHGTESFGVTYDAAPASITPPSRDKYTFWGYYTGENGKGTKLIDRDGNVLASVSGYTSDTRKWKYAGDLTLYAYLMAKKDQTINWTLTENDEYPTGKEMGATATSNLQVTYTSNHPEWGYINENGRLVVVEPNKTITITASQVGDDYYNAANPVTKTFITLGANPNQYTDVHATNITYGQTLSASTLSGAVKLNDVVIAGTLAWVDPEIMPNAGTANHMVLFTPTNTAAYSSIYFEVPVTVAKATPVITWNISGILRENVRYSHFVESSNKEQSFAVSSPSSLLTISGTTLYTENVDSKQTGLTITITQAASANYNAISDTKTVAIYPRAGICLPFEPMTESDYNQAGVAHNGNVNWCNTDAEGSEKWLDFYTVYFTQYKGIAIGSWQGGFNYDEKYIDLFFSGIPENISFKAYLQTVTTSEHVHWPATAGEVTVMESEDGSTFTTVIGSPFNASSSGVSFSGTLKSETRYVRLIYSGNFTCYFQNVNITQKKYLTVNKSELTFGTETNPLQEPQAITLSYSSLGVCGGMEDAITVTSSNPAFYVDEPTITENVGIEQKGSYTIRVRCNDVNQSGTLTFTSNDGTSKEVSVRSTNPPIRTAATDIFQTGTEHNPVSGTAYRAQRTLFTSDILDGLFDGSTPLFDTLYIYGVSESDSTFRTWEYSPAKGYKVPVVEASNVHTPCFVYKKDGAQYTYVRTFDAATTTLDVADTKTRVLVGYRPESTDATTALQMGTGAVVNLNNTEIVSTGVSIRVNGDTATVVARGKNTVTSASNAAVQLSGATTLGIEDNWKTDEPSGILSLRPALGYPSIDLGSASGRVYINGTQLELHNAAHMAIAHMEGTTEHFDGEVHINDGTIIGEETLGMPKRTFIDGGTFNDGTVVAYTLKGKTTRPRNSNGDMLSRKTMTPEALKAYEYGQAHLVTDHEAKVNPMLMDAVVWIFNGAHNTQVADDPDNWNKDGVPGENDDVLINAPMVVSGGEMKVRSLTINWEDKGKGIPAVTVNPDGGLTVGEGGVDMLKLANPAENLVLKADQEAESATKGQTGYLRIHPNSAEPMPQANVELFSIAYKAELFSADTRATWQYVGSPLVGGEAAKPIFKNSYIYNWNESTGEWENNRKTLVLHPFEGYATTQYKNNNGMLTTFAGQLADNQTKVIPLKYDEKSAFAGCNIVANSFTAPIDIAKMDLSDFSDGVEATIYIFNTGSSYQVAKGVAGAGQYTEIPVAELKKMAKGFSLPTVIPAMQGFLIKTTKAGSLTLDYSRIIMDDDERHSNTPLHAKRKNQEKEEYFGTLRVSLEANGWRDFLYILESDEYVADYENGSDTHKMLGGTVNIFAMDGDDALGVDATNSIIGTRIGVRTADTTAYVMSFSHLRSDKELLLLDNETEQTIKINEGTEYSFFAQPNSMITDRFVIIEGEKAPEITTGLDSTMDDAKVHKFIKDNQLYILKNGVLYNAVGARVH